MKYVKKSIIFVVVLILSMGLAGCTSKDEKATDAAVQSEEDIHVNAVGIVNGQEILISTFDKYYSLYIAQYGEEYLNQITEGEKNSAIIKEGMVNSLVQNQVIKQKVDADGVAPTQEKIESEFMEFTDILENDQERKAELEKLNIDEEFIKFDIETLLYNIAYKDMLASEISEDDVRLSELYENYIVEVEASHILFEDATLALEVEEKLLDGEDFAELAKEFSQDHGTVEDGGYLGYFNRGEMVYEFEEMAFSLNIGEISQPIETVFGYHIIKVTDKNTINTLIEENAAESKIEDYKLSVIEAEVERIYKTEIETLVKNADIELFEDRIYNGDNETLTEDDNSVTE